MEYAYEIIEAIRQYVGSEKEMVKMLRDLSKTTTCPAFTTILEEEIEATCNAYGWCPKCFHPTYIEFGKDLVGEFHGHPAYENHDVLYCKHCGWKGEE